MTRSLSLALALFAAHLLEEALTGMHDDRLIVAAYAWLAPLGGRHAAYLVFQLTVLICLGAVFVYAHGIRGRRLLLAAFGLSLFAESHHAVRALATLSWNSGLVTSLPLPILGAMLLRRAFASSKDFACSTTSSSPWASGGSSSDSRPSSPPDRALDCSGSRKATTTPPHD